MAAQNKGRDFWQAPLEAWRESGLTQRAYCRRHELPEGDLSHWKHRLRKEQRRLSAKTQLVPIRVVKESAPGNVDQEGDLAWVFGSGLRLEIGNGFNPITLRRVLEVLGDGG